MKDRAPRIAIFTHDTFGLGHVRRSLHITRSLARAAPESALLLITGSPALHAMKRLPRNADYVKIPTIAKTGSEERRPPHLPIGVKETTKLRERLIRHALVSFAPDVLLVDNFPLGSRGELRRVLEVLRESPTRTVLGLRDIVDLPETVRVHWTRDGIYEVLERCYDRILIYGSRRVLDVAEAYDLPPSVGAKLRYCGYVTGEVQAERSSTEVLAELGFPTSLVVATVGGGGDGIPLVKNFLRALQGLPEVSALVVTGPLMSPVDRSEVDHLASGCRRVVVRGSVDDLPSYLAAANLVVAMGGYNTVAEILTLGCRALIVPRNWRYGEYAKGVRAGFEGEQLLRAQALEKAGAVELVHPEALDPQTLRDRIAAALARVAAPEIPRFDLGGLGRVTEHLLRLAGFDREEDHVEVA